MPRVVIVGQAPSWSTRGQAKPFSGASGRRLAALLDVSHEELLDGRVDLVNLLPRWPGRGDSNHPLGDHFPMAAARSAARRLRVALDGCVVVMCGKNVRDAFGLTQDFFEMARVVDHFTYVVIPHPSGVNRWWNDEQNYQRAERYLRRKITPLICN
jgi:uracil-DNA glycosylase